MGTAGSVWRERRRWRERGRLEQVEASTRWTLSVIPWFLCASGLLSLTPSARQTPQAFTLLLTAGAVAVVCCVSSSAVLRPALDAYAEERPAPPRVRLALCVQGAALAVLTAGSAVVAAADALGEEGVPGMALFAVQWPFMVTLGLVVSRRAGIAAAVGVAAVAAAVHAVIGLPGPQVAMPALLLLIGTFSALFSARCTGWYLAVLRELDTARAAQAQLAVAEERLRFSRDLHDVMGRHLSAIALKSELATQLAARDPAAAAAQMTEVQQLARDSQREVRAVVRGYREADLGRELEGARGVLTAAGVEVSMETGDAVVGLPETVQAALGWVVREGTTNVLRHAEAVRCTLRLHRAPDDGRVVLVMENDGAVDGTRVDGTKALDGAGRTAEETGTGLRGLRERLAPLGGTLKAHPPAPGRFRLTVELAVPGRARAHAGSAGGGAA